MRRLSAGGARSTRRVATLPNATTSATPSASAANTTRQSSRGHREYLRCEHERNGRRGTGADRARNEAERAELRELRDDFFSAAKMLQTPGYFSIAGHARPDHIRDQRSALPGDRISAEALHQIAVQNGLRQGEPTILAGCNQAGAFAQAFADLNQSTVFAANGYVRYGMNEAYNISTITATANEDGTGGARSFQLHTPGGKAVTSETVEVRTK